MSFQPFTNDTSLLTSKIGSLDLEIATSSSETDISNGISNATTAMVNIGDGSSTAKRKSYLVLLTDGVEDIKGAGGGKSPINTAYCAAAKAKGIIVIAVQTTYPTNLDDNGFKKDVLPILPAVATAMKNCASRSDLYFVADDGPSIEKAMNEAFNKIFGNFYVSQ